MLISAALAGTVLAAVHHADVIAHRVGEPFGSLILGITLETEILKLYVR
ncbi:hypothetical protein [Streptomyces sp. NPDC056600]